jgi:putative oxidoreductase
MKKVLSVNNTSNLTDAGLLVARLGISALMLTHGIPKLLMLLSGDSANFPAVLGLSAGISLGLAVFAEVVCSVFLLAGFATRLSVIPLIVTMLIAVFFIHAADPFSIKESALHYLLVYVALLFTGAGKYSVDYLITNKSQTRKVTSQKAQNPRLSVYQ